MLMAKNIILVKQSDTFNLKKDMTQTTLIGGNIMDPNMKETQLHQFLELQSTEKFVVEDIDITEDLFCKKIQC